MTHWHHDHVGGLPHVLRMLEKLRAADATVPAPRVHKFVDAATDSSFHDRIASLPPSTFVPVPEVEGAAAVHWPLRDVQTVQVADPDAPESVSSLRMVLTPGHAVDHACMLLEEDNILLTGDNVLGRGSTVFEDLVLYLRSLQRCQALMSQRKSTPIGVYGTPAGQSGNENVFLPGHGPVIPKGQDTLKRYITHRLDRDEQILALLSGAPGDKTLETEAVAYPGDILTRRLRERSMRVPWTLHQLVAVLYADYEKKMYPAVARGLLLHLQKLSQDYDTLKKPPFYTLAPLPTTPWASGAAIVKSLTVPSYQYSGTSIPDAARTEAEWWELMDVPWVLLG